MNVFDFINSRDMAEHLKNIDYRFSPVEAAWLVWQSKNHTIKEKHAAWREIIGTSDDCAIENLSGVRYDGGLHQYLQDYMDMENALIADFLQSDGDCVYTYKMLFEDEDAWCEDEDFFFSFEDTFSAFSEDIDLKPRFVEFVKSKTGKFGYKIYCRMTADKEIVKINRSEFLQDEKGGNLFYHILDWDFRFPTPFQEGDVLTTVCGRYTALPFVGGTFVLCHGDTEMEREYRRYELVNGREATPYGYFLDRNYGICRELVDDSAIRLIDCEYVRSDLKDEDKLLLPISNYLKGKIDLAHLLTAYRIITCEHTLSISREPLVFVSDELKDMGVALK